jgi:hypothetical protein
MSQASATWDGASTTKDWTALQISQPSQPSEPFITFHPGTKMPTGPPVVTSYWSGGLYQLEEAIFELETWNPPSDGKEALGRLDERIKSRAATAAVRVYWKTVLGLGELDEGILLGWVGEYLRSRDEVSPFVACDGCCWGTMV